MMKKVLLLTVVLVVLVALLWQFKFQLFEPEPAKVYRTYRQRVMAAKGYDNKMTSSTQWSLKIKSCKVEGSKAVVLAREVTAKIPPNAASFVFATYVKRDIKANLIKRGDTWTVSREEYLLEEVSTYEDRKK